MSWTMANQRVCFIALGLNSKPSVGNQVIWIMSKLRDFFKDLREGLIPPEELQRRYRGLKDQGLVTI